jgi:hypothetical protein
MVHTDEREPEPADVVLHLPDDTAGIGPRVHPVDEPGRRLVGLQPAFRSPAQQEELELVADGDAEALVLGGGDRSAQDVAGVGFEGLPVETAIGEADGRLSLPRNDPESLQVGSDLHVAEVDLVPNPGPVGHDPRMVDGEDRHAEVEPFLTRSLEHV